MRDASAMQAVVNDGADAFGRLDIVIANAGIIRLSDSVRPHQVFQDIVDVNLVGVWNTVEAAIPALIEGGRGGSVVLASSTRRDQGGPAPIGRVCRPTPRRNAPWSG